MAITYPLDFPSGIVANRYSISMRSIQGISENPFTGKQTVYEWPGQWLELSLSFPPLSVEQGAVMKSFMLSLNGKKGSFRLEIPGYSRLGAGGGVPVLSAQALAGVTSIAVSGFPVSTTVLKAGDLLSFPDGQLKVVVGDVLSDVSGNALIDIFPKIRANVASGTGLEIDAPKGIFVLSSSDVGWSRSVYDYYAFTLDCEEKRA